MSPELQGKALEKEFTSKDLTAKEALGIRAGMRLIPEQDHLALSYNQAIEILIQDLYGYTDVPLEVIKERLASARVTAKIKLVPIFEQFAPNFLPISQEQINSVGHLRIKAILSDANRVEECYGKPLEKLFEHPRPPRKTKSKQQNEPDNLPVRVKWEDIVEEHIYFLYRRMIEHRGIFEGCEAIPKSWQERYYHGLKPKYQSQAVRMDSRTVLNKVMSQILDPLFVIDRELDDDMQTLLVVSRLLGSKREVKDFLNGTW